MVLESEAVENMHIFDIMKGIDSCTKKIRWSNNKEGRSEVDSFQRLKESYQEELSKRMDRQAERIDSFIAYVFDPDKKIYRSFA